MIVDQGTVLQIMSRDASGVAAGGMSRSAWELRDFPDSDSESGNHSQCALPIENKRIARNLQCTGTAALDTYPD
jgi:hypothetical protein